MAVIGCFHKGKTAHITQTQRKHLQNNRGQIGAQNFWIGKFRAA
jgi:hypothetical protein